MRDKDFGNWATVPDVRAHMPTAPFPRLAVIAVISAALLVGCGHTTLHTGAQATTPPASGAGPRHLPLLSGPATAGLKPMPGTLVSVQGGRHALLRLQYGGCSGPPVGATVADTPASVTVTPYHVVKAGQLCAAFLADAEAVVDLPTPLGSRILTVS
ncbi:MAG: hypothetical protein ACRDXE_00925 [Acidimicrobiales bacterium]